MRVLGLDLSVKPGFAVMDDGELVQHGTRFESKTDREIPPAIVHCEQEYHNMVRAERVAKFMAELAVQNSPDYIYIEQINLGKSRDTQKFIDFIHCHVLQALEDAGYAQRVRYVDSSQWRSYCGLNMTKDQRDHNKDVSNGIITGKITKKHLAVWWANKKFNLNLKMKDNDAAEAIGIAHTGINRALQETQNTIKSEDIDKALSN